VILFEDLKNANVREAARKTAAQSEAQSDGDRRAVGILAAPGFPHQRGKQGVNQRSIDRS
jgi:hypothetical protein